MNEQYRMNTLLIREWLLRQDLTHAQLAGQLKVGLTTVTRILAGWVPKHRTLKALAVRMGVDDEFALVVPRESESQTA